MQYGCLVVNAPTANTIAAAEHGIAMLCALTRNIAQADASVKRGEWKRTKYVGVSLVGKTLAIMGFGKVSARLLPPSPFLPFLPDILLRRKLTLNQRFWYRTSQHGVLSQSFLSRVKANIVRYQDQMSVGYRTPSLVLVVDVIHV